MNPDTDLHLESIVGPGLPPPPPLARDVVWQLQAQYIADFYASPHYDAWYQRTCEEMRHAKPFVWID